MATSSLPQKNIGYNVNGINQRGRTQRKSTGLYNGLVVRDNVTVRHTRIAQWYND